MAIVQDPVSTPLPLLSTEPARRTRWRLSWRSQRVLPAILVIALAILGPLVAPFNPRMIVAPPDLSPSLHHLFGTDTNGYDVFSRVLAGFQIDVAIAAVAAGLASAVGIVVGLLTGMNESRSDLIGKLAHALARFVDLVQAVPSVVIGIVGVALYGSSELALMLVIAFIMFPIQARTVRVEVLRVRSEAYVQAGKIAGLGSRRLIIRHVLPNATWPAFEFAPILFGSALLLVGSLGFLGVGIPAPAPEWGLMISAGASDAAVGRWWSFLFPSLAVVVCVASASLLFFSGRGPGRSGRSGR